MKKLIVLWTTLLLLTAGMRASPAIADHDPALRQVAAEAEAIKCLTDDLRGGLRRQFNRSNVYQELMSTNNQINSVARRVRNTARSGSDIRRLLPDVESLSRGVDELAGLLREAFYRSSRGVDNAILGFNDPINGMVSELAAKADSLRRLVGSAARTYDRQVYQGSGYGGYGYGGTYYRNNTVPYNRSNNSMHPRSKPGNHFQNGNRPIGVYGPSGRGVEFGNGGVVLKLGGTQIRLK
jgi:hypothetical protein